MVTERSVARTSMANTRKDVIFFQAEDGIRYLVRSRGLGDVYKRQADERSLCDCDSESLPPDLMPLPVNFGFYAGQEYTCLLYTSDAADERSSVDLGGRRIIKKKQNIKYSKN